MHRVCCLHRTILCAARLVHTPCVQLASCRVARCPPSDLGFAMQTLSYLPAPEALVARRVSTQFARCLMRVTLIRPRNLHGASRASRWFGSLAYTAPVCRSQCGQFGACLDRTAGHFARARRRMHQPFCCAPGFTCCSVWTSVCSTCERAVASCSFSSAGLFAFVSSGSTSMWTCRHPHACSQVLWLLPRGTAAQRSAVCVHNSLHGRGAAAAARKWQEQAELQRKRRLQQVQHSLSARTRARVPL